MTANIAGILLAAGRGVRFDSDKLLHPLSDGTPVAVASARSLRAACSHCLAVLRPEQHTLAQLLTAEGFTILHDARAAQGMGSNLAIAVQAAASADGWIVALGDMPFLSSATTRSVVTALENGASLAAPYVSGSRGHPVGFSRVWFDALSGLQGDQGARELIRLHQDDITRIPCEDKGALRDVDTPGDLSYGS